MEVLGVGEVAADTGGGVADGLAAGISPAKSLDNPSAPAVAVPSGPGAREGPAVFVDEVTPFVCPGLVGSPHILADQLEVSRQGQKLTARCLLGMRLPLCYPRGTRSSS